MSRSASFDDSSCVSGEDTLEQRKEELEDLMQQIDHAQDELEETQNQIAELQIQIRRNQSKINIKKGVDEKLFQEHGNKSSYLVEIDRSLLSDEHAGLIASKENSIDALSTQKEKMEANIQHYEEEIDALMTENNQLEAFRLTLKATETQTHQELKSVQNECEILEQKIKEVTTNKKTIESLQRQGEITLSGLLTRESNLTVTEHGEVEYRQQIKNLDQIINTELEEIGDLRHKIEESEQEFQSEMDDQENLITQKKTLVNWESEKRTLQKEFKAASEELESTKKQANAIDSRVNISQNRYKKLKPVVDKWAPEFRGTPASDENAPAENIAKLLNQLASVSTEKTSKNTDKEQRLNEMITINANKYATLNKRKDELTRAINRFSTEQTKLKKQIQDRRTQAFEEEHRMVEQINVLKKKRAAKRTHK